MITTMRLNDFNQISISSYRMTCNFDSCKRLSISYMTKSISTDTTRKKERVVRIRHARRSYTIAVLPLVCSYAG